MSPRGGVPELWARDGIQDRWSRCPDYPEPRSRSSYARALPARNASRASSSSAKKGRRPFWGCERFPDCAFTVSSKPVVEPCPVCGGLQVQAGKGVLRCIVCNPPKPFGAADGEANGKVAPKKVVARRKPAARKAARCSSAAPDRWTRGTTILRLWCCGALTIRSLACESPATNMRREWAIITTREYGTGSLCGSSATAVLQEIAQRGPAFCARP